MSNSKKEPDISKMLSPPGGFIGALLVIAGVGALAVLSVGMYGHFRLLRDKEEWKGRVAQRETEMKNIQERIMRYATAEEDAKASMDATREDAARAQGETAVIRSDLAKQKNQFIAVRAAVDQIETQLKEVTQKRDETAQQHSTLTNTISELTSKIATLKPQGRQLQDAVAELQNSKQVLDGEIAADRTRQETMRKTLDQLTTDLAVKRTDLEKTSAGLHQAQISLGALRVEADKAQRLADTITELGKERTTLEALIEGLKRDLQQLEQRQPTLAANIKQQENQRDKLNADIADLTTRRATLAAEVGQADGRKANLQADAESLATRINTLDGQIGVLASKKGTMEKELAEIKSTKTSAAVDSAQEALITAQVLQLTQEKAQLEADVKLMRSRLDTLIPETAAAQAKLNDLRRQLADTQAEEARYRSQQPSVTIPKTADQEN